jgi:hypothetical protein
LQVIYATDLVPHVSVADDAEFDIVMRMVTEEIDVKTQSFRCPRVNAHHSLDLSIGNLRFTMAGLSENRLVDSLVVKYQENKRT